MKTAGSIVCAALALICLAAGPTTQPAYLAPDSFDFKTLLGEPPADGSTVQRDEIASMRTLQILRSPEDVERCNAEVNASAMAFARPVLGEWFSAKNLPETAALFKEITQQTSVVSGAAKATWARKRPNVTDDRLKPCVQLEKTYSYPSGHATRGMVWGVILAEMFPEHRDALIAAGRRFGTDRTLAGVHYPSDVAAGQKLGADIARRMLADPAFAARLEKAKEECLMRQGEKVTR